MSLPALIAVIVGSGIVWCAVSTTAAVVFARVIARRDKAEQQPPPRPDWPDESPFDLQGFALDSAFYAVLAPSFREYH